MENQERFLPPDLANLVDKYQKENNPGREFVQILSELDQIFVWHFRVDVEPIKAWIETYNYPIEVIKTTGTKNGSLKIKGELPCISDENLKELVLAMAKGRFQLSLLNFLLKDTKSKFRIIEEARDGDRKGFITYDAGSSTVVAKFAKEFVIVELK